MGVNAPYTDLDASQTVQQAFEPTNDAFRVDIVSGSITASNPSVGLNGAVAPASTTQVGGVGPDGHLHPILTDNAGVQKVYTLNSLVPTAYDETVLTYVGATTNIATVVYKLLTVTVATLTLTYDGSNRLIDVVKS